MKSHKFMQLFDILVCVLFSFPSTLLPFLHLYLIKYTHFFHQIINNGLIAMGDN